MANVKTYKMEPETSEKLQKICEELNLTWDGTFQTLANLYMQQKAIGALPERGMEVKEFQSLLNRVSEAFTYALTVNADAEERIRQEFAKKFASQQQDLAAEKTRADLAAKAAKEAELRAKEQEGQAKTLREQMEKLTRDLSHAKEDARLAAKAQADAGTDAERPVKTFKDYEPGFVHVDIKYLPQMPDETARRYLYVGIDRATRWVFVRIYADMETTSAVDFVNRLHEAAPMRIDKLLTDNGACFTDRFQRKSRTPSGKHHFDVRCRALGIEHRLCPPRHPQTNGLVERFNGRIAEITAQTRFHSAAELEQTLMNYVKVYNTIPFKVPAREPVSWGNEEATGERDLGSGD